MTGYEAKACRCGENLDDLSDMSYGEPLVASGSGDSFPSELSSCPLPVPPLMSSVPAADIPIPSSELSSSDNTGDRPLIADPVLVERIVVPRPMYQHFPGQEQVEFFQDVPVTNWHFSHSFHFIFTRLMLIILFKFLSYHQAHTHCYQFRLLTLFQTIKKINSVCIQSHNMANTTLKLQQTAHFKTRRNNKAI